MKKLSLFSGIGGDDLASEWAGIETVCFVEKDTRCSSILRQHWPDTPIFQDVRSFGRKVFYEATHHERVDIISGGDPCQPNSTAGKRRGAADDRYLWPEMFRIVREFKPNWVVNENTSGRLSMDIDSVLADLESEGYEVQPFHIPAAGAGAPHPRYRIFVVAHLNLLRCGSTTYQRPRLHGQESPRTEVGASIDSNSSRITVARRPQTPILPSPTRWDIENGLYSPQFCRVDDGVSDRMDRTKELGNAVVPQQIYPIYKAIVAVEDLMNTRH